ncbi:TRAF3-interacting protein 1 isoform X1 [Ochotona curzoniae]|uniref:TRAF3-interacting protein 1 isoform X1 n=1 Tax=Ochotona curzoniae TaxID=130825 RepID=UPI001B35319D|nr:TRAF3-interacting protein 1 isoform X1 [Ochotona curzoniae]
MNAAVVRRTQEALGKVIRRPPLTEKLLTKPPFRYLHDIVTEVIRVTGFMKGLYTDAELKSDNVKDKDAKISFLQKAIDVVVMVSGEPLLVKPARIVAGHEPERTNELLQAIGKCCLSKLSSEEAVKRVLAGEKGDVKGRASLASGSQEPDNKNVREEEPQSRKEKEDKRSSEIKDRRSRDGKQREESKPRDKEEDRDGPRDSERAKPRARADRERDREERRGEAGRDKDKLRDKGKDRRRVRNGEHARDPDREKADRKVSRGNEASTSLGEIPKKLSEGSFKDSRADMETEISRGAPKSVTSKSSKRRSKNSVEGRKEDNVSAKALDPIVSGLNSEPKREAAAAELGTEGASTNSASVSDGNSPRLWRETAEPEPAARQRGDSASDAEGEAGPAGREKSEVSESSEVPNEPASSVRRIPRPGSARPAPPRVRRQESVEVLATDRAGSGKAVSSVIIDSQNGDSGEDDQFVVDAAPQLLEMSPLETVPAAELEEDEKHGGLVKKILETKKDYEKGQQPSRPGEKEKSLVFESAWKKEKDVVSKEMERLRVSIQTLCKSALPLGKIMDYIQEDVDAMQNELQLWHGENRQHAQALQEEQSVTDAAVEPLKAELAELEQLIKDQQDKICAVKASVLRNEEKIQKMIHSINLTAQKVDT